LSISNNDKITDINHLVNLRILYAQRLAGLDNRGFTQLTNLVELYAPENKKITDVNHLVNLHTLSARGCCGIDDQGISKLTNLTKLDSGYNPKITKKIDI
jgi:hypothetical protein